jgi:WD40 repeat protein
VATAVGPQPGDQIGKYKLLQMIGEGGMGEVWMAEQTEQVRRRVAIKLIQEGRDSKQVLARFEAERQALALMDHPNIAKVLDAGTTDGGRPYFVMELVKGIPITEFCDQEHLTPKQRIELFIHVCQAVQHAHQKGIIHRDLKPSNILVGMYDDKPVPKVIDFGVAKALHQKLTDRTMFTEVGSIVGTVEYMAPEQAQLNNLDIDTRADVYALGVVLYELLAGTPPFTSLELRSAAYDEMLRMIREVEPPKPSTKLSGSAEVRLIAVRRKLDPKRLAKEVHGDLDWIVMKCLEKDRARRYETANGLAADLKRHLVHEPVSAGPPSVTYRLRKWARRKPAMAALIGLAFMVPVLVVGLLTWHANRVQGMNDQIQEQSTQVAKEANAARAAEQKERVQRDVAEERERNTQRHLYAANLGLFPRVWDSGRPIGLYELLDSTRPERTGGQDLRGWEWFRLHHVIQPEGVRYRGHSTPIQSAVFSPDGTRVASTGTDGIVVVWDARSGKEQLRIHISESQVLRLAFHPDGRRLAIACHDGTAGVIDIESGKRVLRLDGHLLSVNHIAFSPDGRILATCSADNSIKIWDSRSGRLQATLLGHQAGVGRLWFDRSSKRLASIGGDSKLRFWSLTDFTEDKKATLPIESAVCSINGDFSLIAFLIPSQRDIRLIKVVKPNEAISFSGSERPVRDLAFSDDGQHLGAIDTDGDTQVWNLSNETIRRTAIYRGWSETLAFSHKGDRVVCACADQSVKIWPTVDNTRTVFRGHDGWTRRVAINPSGTLIASGDALGSIRIWDARTSEHKLTLGLHIAQKGPADAPKNPALKAMEGRPLRNVIGFSPPAGGKFGPDNVREVFIFAGHAAEILGLAFAPDGTTLASAAGDTDVRLWNVSTGDELHALAHPQRTSSLDYSPDSARLVTGCWDDNVRIWNAKTGELEFTLKEHDDNVEAVLFHPSGKRVISAGIDKIIRVWDLTSRTVVQKLVGHTGSVHSLAISPDGRTLASGSSDESIRVWDMQTGTVRHVLQGHTGRVTGLQLLPTQDRLLSTSDTEEDSRLRVWDLKIGREIVSLLPPYVLIYGMAFDHRGQRLAVTAGRDIGFWDATEPARAGLDQPTKPKPKSQSDVIQFPSNSDPRILGYRRTKDLGQLHNEKNRLHPEKEGNEFMVVALSIPYEHLYPSHKEYVALQAKHRDDPDEKPAAPIHSYALHRPHKFNLVLADGKERRAFGVSPVSFSKSLGFNRGVTIESSTATFEAQERSLIYVAWEVGPTDAKGPFQVRFDGGEAIAIPELSIENYRGDVRSGGTARRAGVRYGGTHVLREQRNYSVFENEK